LVFDSIRITCINYIMRESDVFIVQFAYVCDDEYDLGFLLDQHLNCMVYKIDR
jgi:hypothetical protein